MCRHLFPPAKIGRQCIIWLEVFICLIWNLATLYLIVNYHLTCSHCICICTCIWIWIYCQLSHLFSLYLYLHLHLFAFAFAFALHLNLHLHLYLIVNYLNCSNCICICICICNFICIWLSTILTCWLLSLLFFILSAFTESRDDFDLPDMQIQSYHSHIYYKPTFKCLIIPVCLLMSWNFKTFGCTSTETFVGVFEIIGSKGVQLRYLQGHISMKIC